MTHSKKDLAEKSCLHSKLKLGLAVLESFFIAILNTVFVMNNTLMKVKWLLYLWAFTNNTQAKLLESFKID